MPDLSSDRSSFSGAPQIYIKNPVTGEMEDLQSARLGQRSSAEPDPQAASWLGRVRAEIKCLAERMSGSKEQAAKEAAAVALAELLRFSNLPLRNRVLQALRACPDAAVPGLLSALRSADPALLQGSLLALGALASRLGVEVKDRAFRSMKPFLRSPDVKIREAGISGVRYLGTESAKQALIAQLAAASDGSSVHLVKELAAFRDPSLLSAVLRRFGVEPEAPECRPSDIPLEAAFLLSPEWLAERLGSPGARLMGVRFGYLDRDLAERLQQDQGLVGKCALLLCEIGIVTFPMISAAGSPADIEKLLHAWHQRKAEFARGFFSDEYLLGERAVDVSLDSSLNGQIDRDLFFSALRQLDRWNLQDKCEPRPFDLKHHQQSAGKFFYRPVDEFRSSCLPAYRETASRLLQRSGCDRELAALLTPFVITELAAVDSETRPENNLEAGCMLESRWLSLGKILEIQDGLMQLKPDYQAMAALEYPEVCKKQTSISDDAGIGRSLEMLTRISNRSLWKFALVDAGAMRRTVSDLAGVSARYMDWLSPGGQSSAMLFQYELAKSPQPDPAEAARFCVRLIQSENRRRHLPSLGVEFQSEGIEAAYAQAWKELLEYFGIPSPRRPEFGSLVEASFRPARSPECFHEALRLLLNMGFCPRSSQTLTCHMSVGLDLGEEAKFLAIGLWAVTNLCTPPGLRRPASKDWHRFAARLMSKGLVYRNTASAPLDNKFSRTPSGTAPRVHTEVRTLTLFPGFDPVPVLSRGLNYLQAGGHSASLYIRKASGQTLAPEESIAAAAWSAYRAKLGDIYRSRYFGGSEVFDSDWYESTGDSRDLELVRNLKIVGAIERWFGFLAAHPGRRAELDRLVDAEAAGLARLLPSDQVSDSEMPSRGPG